MFTAPNNALFNARTEMWDWPFPIEPVFSLESLTKDDEFRLQLVREQTESWHRNLVHRFGD